MRSITILFLTMFLTSLGFAQNAPIDFEAGGNGANWSWTVFENDTNPPVEIISNPYSSGINTSATVAKITALQAGQPWAGTESAHGSTDLGTFTLDSTNSLIKIKVYKSVISDVGIKLVSDSGWALPEIKVANTVINQWEELTFDFSNHTNPPAGDGVYDQIVVFPDFDLGGRTQDNIVYFDDITFNVNNTTAVGPSVAAPTPPNLDTNNVISIFSNAFNNLPNTDFNPAWGQSTIVTQPTIQGDDVLKYASFNFQGTTLSSSVDASGMDYLHVDLWTADNTNINIFCISSGPVEQSYTLNVTPNQWVSYDIPISAFANIDLTDVFQFKFDGGTGSETYYLDNIYFYIAPPSGPQVAAPTPPARDTTKYVSIFSNAYNDVPNTDFNPAWGQSTVMTTVQIQGDDVIKYENFNYQGTTFASSIDVSSMDFIHLDMWTADASTVNLFCVSSGPVESSYSLTFTQSQWESYDIPLSDFSGVDLADLIQLKFDGGTGTETIYLDNIYFYMDDTGINSEDSNSDFNIYPNPVNQGETITLSENVIEFKVYDLSGKLVQKGNSKQFNTSEMNQGMYIVEMNDENGYFQTEKLIIK